MSSISIIGSGNMASAIGALAVKGGNAVEIIGRDASKAAPGQGARQRRHGSNVGAAPDRTMALVTVEMCGARQSGHADRVCKMLDHHTYPLICAQQPTGLRKARPARADRNVTVTN